MRLNGTDSLTNDTPSLDPLRTNHACFPHRSKPGPDITSIPYRSLGKGRLDTSFWLVSVQSLPKLSLEKSIQQIQTQRFHQPWLTNMLAIPSYKMPQHVQVRLKVSPTQTGIGLKRSQSCQFPLCPTIYVPYYAPEMPNPGLPLLSRPGSCCYLSTIKGA
jgi:hypothetical protein